MVTEKIVTDEQDPIDVMAIVNELSVVENTIKLFGTMTGLNDTELANFDLKIKKRRTKTHYILPLAWSNQSWTGDLEIENYIIDPGVWDFYLHDPADDVDYRIKITDDELELTGQGLYNLSEKSLHFNVYRTVKDSLSLNVDAAHLTIDKLAVAQTENTWKHNVTSDVSDRFLQEMISEYPSQIVFIQRRTLKRISIPFQVNEDNEPYSLNFNVNYQKFIDFDDVSKRGWDGYLSLQDDAQELMLRIHLAEDNDELNIEADSLTEFKYSHIYQIYFYKTVKQNLSIKLHRAEVKQGIKSYHLDENTLRINGWAYLDIVGIDESSQLNNFIIVRKRESNEVLSIDLAYDPTKEVQDINVEIPLQKIVNLEVIEKEIFDVSIQYDYQDAVYEKKLGFQDFTYIKDDVFAKVFTKNKSHYTRVYLTQTPNGNLKIETFYLTKPAYYYLQYGQKLDQKLSQKREVWLIGERANTAQDTGYHFFKYCRTHHPEIDVYYVINSGSKDIENIEALGNVLYTGTFKHTRMASLASVFIGSHDLDNILPLKGLDLDNYVNGKRVFLQHGVLGRKNVEYHKKYYRDPFHLFCVSSEPEKKLVQEKMDYKSNEVKVTGLSRFDELLNDRHERQSILLMPTWREWLGSDERFRKSVYYDRYKSLLTNETLIDLLEKNNLILDFYPHYRMQPFIDEFKALKSERVNIIELGEKTVQQLLLENKLLITDYSSVSFDFNYMSKPIVFYHFDSKAFFKNGILRPKVETFLGDICLREDEVIDAIKYYVTNNFKEREEISNKKDRIFSNIDTNNNHRIFDEIQKLQSESD